MHIPQRSGSIYLIDYVEIHAIQVIEPFQNSNFRLCIQTSSQNEKILVTIYKRLFFVKSFGKR